MDGGGSWLLQAAGGYTGASWGGDSWSWGMNMMRHDHEQGELEQDQGLSSQAMQMQHKLSQIDMLMDMDEHDHQYYAGEATPAPAQARHASCLLPPSSSSSSSFRSFSPARPSLDDNTSSLMLAAGSSNANASCFHNQEVSSEIPFPPVSTPIGHGDGRRPRDHQHGSSVEFRNIAFRPYSGRCLGPAKKLRPGSCGVGVGGGQRAIKKAMSVLSRMHAARLAQHYQMREMAAAAARARPPSPAAGSNNDHQLQHVLSERKRREKLNDSFKALRAALPPAPKKDKTSVLIRAKEYVNALKSRVSELEEKINMLADDADQSQLHRGGGDGELQDDDHAQDDKRVKVEMSRSSAEGRTTRSDGQCQEIHLKITLRSSGCSSAMDAVAGVLECLKESEDVNLVDMNTTGRSSGLLRAKTFPRSTSISCVNDEFLKESVIKVIKDVMESETVTT